MRVRQAKGEWDAVRHSVGSRDTKHKQQDTSPALNKRNLMEYEKIKTIADLLKWISNSKVEEWKCDVGVFKDMVNTAMVKIRALEKLKEGVNLR